MSSYSFDEVKTFIENEKYTLLSKKYINARIKMKIKCPVGHVYEASFGKFKHY
jgi:hypothetical protein